MPEPVTEFADGDVADREGGQVGVGDPLDAGQGGVPVELDGRVGRLAGPGVCCLTVTTVSL